MATAGHARRAAVLAALAALVAPAPPGARAEPGGPVPDRRVLVETGVDFPGGDLRSVFGTRLPICRDLCLGEPACAAFTFNSRVGACFLKDGIRRRTGYAGAISGVLVPTDSAVLRVAPARAADLGFLPAGRLEAAHAAARAAALDHPAEGADAATLAQAAATAGDPATAAAALLAAAAAEDGAARWLAASEFLATSEPDDWLLRDRFREAAVAAGINAYLRATDTETAAAAARALARALEAAGEGRAALDALRLSARLAPDAAIVAEVARAEALYGFRLRTTEVEFDSAAPRACFAFSEALAPAPLDHADFVRVAPLGEGAAGAAAEPFAVEVEGERLCVEGLLHGARYTVTLRAGLPSATGETLRAAVAQEVHVRDRTPAARFPGRAYVLPKSTGAAIPVTTVNAETLAMRLHRVGERSVAAVLRDREFGGALSGFAEGRIGTDFGETVWEGTAEIAPALNRDVVTALPVGEAIRGLDPGLYVLTARVHGRPAEDWQPVATQWFVVTDLGIATLKGADGLHVFLRGLGDARPREGVEVRLIARNNEVLGRGTTDATGHLRFDAGLLRGLGGAEAAHLTAEAAGDFAFLSLVEPPFDLSDRGVEGRPAPPPVDVFVALVRGAYRPGETVHATVLARDARAAAVEDLPLTAVVTRPDGVEHARLMLPDAGAGGRVLALPLDAGAQRGGWRLALHADPAAPPLAVAGFLVEDFVPERIDLALTLPEGPIDRRAPPTLEAAARFLWGAPGAELALEGEVSLAPVRSLPGLPGHRFGLADEPFAAARAPLPAGRVTDADGTARLALPLPDLGPVSGPLQATVTLRAADGSGRPVERSATRLLRPEAPLIGIRPLFEGALDEGGTAVFEAIALGPDLEPVALAPVAWTLSRIETRFQWYEIEGRWSFEPVTRRERVAAGSLALTPDAPARLELPVGWGRYELRLAAPQAGHVVTSVGFEAGWSAGGAAGAETPDRLEVSLDRAAYAVGDVARVRIVARTAGQAQVAVLGDRLIARREVALPEGATVIELPVTADWGAGAYVAASLVRPMDVAAGRHPARAIGLAWAGVDPGPRRLGVALEAPRTVRPRGTLPMRLRIAGLGPGETARATVAAVDLGILNLTGHPPPDPVGHYFGQRRLGVEMRDLYGRLIDPAQGTPGRLRSGGDAGIGLRAPPPPGELVAYFSDVLVADADGTAEIRVPLPAFNGTLRVSAVAWTAGGIGQATAEVAVRDPVVVQASAPRFLAPGDRTRLRIDLAHVEGPAGPVAVALSADDPGLLPGPDRLETALVPGGRAVLSVPLQATAPGAHRLEVATTTPAGEALADAIALPVRIGDPPLARQSRIALAPGAALRLDAEALAGLDPAGATVTVASGPLADFDVPGLLAALDAYPWGCTEQIIARAMPLLYFGAEARALGLDEPPGIAARIAAAIRGVLANQTGAGGFGLWAPEGWEPWLDAFATDFLGRARAAGHHVPDRAFEAALANLRNRVNAHPDFERGGEDLAYALMVLAREGRAAIGDLRYWADARADAFATPLAQAQLGFALAAYGEQTRADAMFRRAEAGALRHEADTGHRADFGTARRDAAGVLALAAAAGSAAVDRPALAARVTAPGDPPSTQEMVWTLLAAHALAEAAAPAAVEGLAPAGPVLRLDAAALAEGRSLRNTGASPTTVVLTAFGVPTEPEPAGGNGYRITRTLHTLDGARADPAALPLNARLVAVLTVTPERDAAARLLVTDPLPAGLEIENPNLLRAGQTGPLAWLAADDVARHAEFRDDRFVAAVDWSGTDSFRLAYMVRAVSPGSFHHPAASVEDMYRPAFRARTAAGRVEIREAP